MRIRTLFLLAPLALTALPASDAQACGGCFTQQTETTQVSGHRMVLSVSQEQTTLYDQISYTGEPAEFAWVLPIRGEVQVAVSSDALFATLEGLTQVVINSPSLNCNTGSCNGGVGGSSVDGSVGPGGVNVIAEQVVGPYETVQLTAEDPAALTAWLSEHGYNIPEDIQPIIDAYVGEGFGFLAVRLIPGNSVDAMQPIAVTTPGAGTELPLRMVAAGSGAITPITLWIVGEGRYEPANFPSFTIGLDEVVWDWDSQRSNYTDLAQQKFAASKGTAWLVESSDPLSPYAFQPLLDLASFDPSNSGYNLEDPEKTALDQAQADVDLLLHGVDRGTAWLTRIRAELPREALAEDLSLQAAADQSIVEHTYFVENTTGTPPQCPPVQDCDDGFEDDGFDEGDGSFDQNESTPWGVDRNGGCTLVRSDDPASAIALGAIGLALAVALRRPRGRRR